MLWKYLPSHLLANLIYPVYFSLQPPGKSIWRGKWDAIKGLKRALQKRRKIQSRRSVSIDELERIMEHGMMKPYKLGVQLRQVLKKI